MRFAIVKELKSGFQHSKGPVSECWMIAGSVGGGGGRKFD